MHSCSRDGVNFGSVEKDELYYLTQVKAQIHGTETGLNWD